MPAESNDMHCMKRLPLFKLLLWMSGILPLPALAQLQVKDLRCMYTTNPLGVETMRPFFSWKMEGNTQNLLQSAYRILVADDSVSLVRNNANYWDSKKQAGQSAVQVYYQGKQLAAAQKYYWKVFIWDNKGKTAESRIHFFQMGLPAMADWGAARWIGYDEVVDSLRIAPHVHLSGKKSWGPRLNVLPMMRREWTIDKPVQSAISYISGLGHFEMFVNGKKTGDHFLDPGWTDYDKQAQYVVFDITSQLQQGNNVIGVMLGNGFYYIPGQRYRKMTGAYGHPKMIMKTMITYKDGSRTELVSDQQWQTAPSPIIYSSIFGGEDYDANKEQKGWSSPGFDAKGWRSVIITKGPPRLTAQLQPPLKIMEQFPAKTKKEIRKNEWVYDIGQNCSGIPSIKVKGNKGDTIRIYCGELINKDGTANQRATGSPSYFNYILKGEGTESWQPQFTYTGFRYMQVQCIPKDSMQSAPMVEEIAGLHTRNAAATVGSFSSSNQLFNDTYKLIDWAIRSNTASVFTDCPHREKLGWLEQTHLMGASVQYNYDAASLNRKVIMDMLESQYPNGKIPEIAPELTVFVPPFDESPEWGSASLILPWYHYQWYGDREILVTAYPMMKAYVDYLLTKDSMFILKHGLGDWFDIGPGRPGVSQMTKKGITATATLYYDLTILTKVANLLWQAKDAARYTQLAAEVKKSFNAAFFDRNKMQYDSASQTANAMALYMGLVEPSNRESVVNALVNDIQKRNNALTAGDIGFRYVLKALEAGGQNELIFAMNNRDDVPGYGYQLKHGATALTESWQAYESVSNNHFMLGHLMEWFYSGMAGIRQRTGSVGYQQLEFKPQPVGDIRFVKAAFQTMYGEVKSSWTKEAGVFTLQIVVPPNTRASVYMPGSVKPILTGSGTYTFKSKI